MRITLQHLAINIRTKKSNTFQLAIPSGGKNDWMQIMQEWYFIYVIFKLLTSDTKISNVHLRSNKPI